MCTSRVQSWNNDAVFWCWDYFSRTLADIKKRSSSRSRRGRRSRSRSRSRSHSRSRRKRSRSKHRWPINTHGCYISPAWLCNRIKHPNVTFFPPIYWSRPPQRLWPRGDSHSSRGGHKRRSRSRDRRHSRSRSRCVGKKTNNTFKILQSWNNP